MRDRGAELDGSNKSSYLRSRSTMRQCTSTVIAETEVKRVTVSLRRSESRRTQMTQPMACRRRQWKPFGIAHRARCECNQIASSAAVIMEAVSSIAGVAHQANMTRSRRAEFRAECCAHLFGRHRSITILAAVSTERFPLARSSGSVAMATPPLIPPPSGEQYQSPCISTLAIRFTRCNAASGSRW